jgi:hypothetical protein
MANNNTHEKKELRKKLNKSYLRAESLLQEIYKNEYLFLVNEGDKAQHFSNTAHDMKDDLLKELDQYEGMMSLNMRATTRKRKRKNNNNNILFKF